MSCQSWRFEKVLQKVLIENIGQWVKRPKNGIQGNRRSEHAGEPVAKVQISIERVNDTFIGLYQIFSLNFP